MTRSASGVKGHDQTFGGVLVLRRGQAKSFARVRRGDGLLLPKAESASKHFVGKR